MDQGTGQGVVVGNRRAGPHGADEQDPHIRHLADEEAQQQDSRLVGPLEIVEDDDER